jgi:hypothetical protein
MTMADKAATDWEAVEREYRAGQLSVREIGRLYSVSHTAINKKAKALGWTQNLAERVREEVSNRLVASEVSTANAKEAVDAAASRAVDVIRSHRHDIATGRDMIATLLSELSEATKNRHEIEEAIEDETADDDGPKRRNMMLKAVALPSRAAVMLSLSGAMRHLIGLERQAFNLGNDEAPKDDDKSGAASKADNARRVAFMLAQAGKQKTE